MITCLDLSILDVLWKAFWTWNQEELVLGFPLTLWFWAPNWSSLSLNYESEICSVVQIYSLRPHGLYSPWILQAIILEWVVFPFSRGSFQLRDQNQVSHIAGRFFTSWATREAQEYWSG